MRFKIDIEIPHWTKWLVAGIAIGVVIGAGAVWAASPPEVTEFADQEVLSADKLNANLRNLKAGIVELQNPDPTCPRGYTQDTSVANYVVCKKGVDEVVKVGNGGSTFWIDRYEASVWAHADGTGTQYGLVDGDFPTTFPQNGQADRANLLFAVSKASVQPSAHITWFQAARACRASGKRLPNGEEWLEAAAGTNDPGSNTGAGGACVTHASGPRATGGGTTCMSTWGAQDMIGSLEEWTAEWWASIGSGSLAASWPSSAFNGDYVYNVSSGAYLNGAWRTGYPVAGTRGGNNTLESQAGVFTLQLSYEPDNREASVGFRCLLPN